MNNDLISREALKNEFKARLSICNGWIVNAKDKETKIRASAVKAFIAEVLMTIDNAPTVEVTKPQSYVMGFCDGLKAQTYEKPPMFERPQSEIIEAYTKGFDTGVETVKNERPQGKLAEKLKDRIEENICKRCPMNNNCVLCEISRVFQIITLTAEEQKGGAK